MARRESLQAKFLTWIEQAPITEAELVLGICSGRLKARKSYVMPMPVIKKARARRRTKAEIAAAAYEAPLTQ